MTTKIYISICFNLEARSYTYMYRTIDIVVSVLSILYLWCVHVVLRVMSSFKFLSH